MIWFVSENYLKTNGIITSNVDATDFSPLIQFASKAFVKRQIGSYFFNDLLAKYNAQTLSADEESLVEVMQYAIAWRACSDAGVTLTNQLKNKGYQKQNGDNSESVDDETVWKMYDHYIQKALYFELELKQFLIDNKNDYPNFLSPLNKDSTIKKESCCHQDPDFNEGVGVMII